MKKSLITFPSADKKTQIHAIRWQPEGEPKAVLQIVHGMVEYIDRYDEFATYLAEQGYVEGERLRTRAYANGEGNVRVCLTVARDMPHGAIADEARAAWEVMSRFKRANGSKRVEEV